MDSTALLNRFRLDVIDTASPPLWTDAEIFSYMDDAQKMFCRLQGGIADSTTTSITTLTVPAGTAWVAVSPKILKFRYIERLDAREVELINFEDVQAGRTAVQFNAPDGPISYAVSGMEMNKLRMLPKPITNETLQLVVYRLPLTDITTSNQALEIDELHHTALLKWMKHLAHLKQDAETFDRGRSAQFEAEFRAYCEQARQERERREHKYRSINYGGY